MSLQVTLGTGSLVAIGLSTSDIATIASLGQRVGSWLTASSGDANFLELLETDELDILTRRGLLDKAMFNKRWGQKMSLLVNDRPAAIQGHKAEAVLGKLSSFTAVMVSIVAALDAFATSDVVKEVVKKLLLALLQSTEFGEDIIISQVSNRINSWRSSAIIRGLSFEARKFRQELLAHNIVLDGLFPKGDVLYLVHFLQWLLSENTTEYLSASSDVMGVAFSLIHLTGLDRPCQLVYNPGAATLIPGHSGLPIKKYFSRTPCTAVNLEAPEESFTAFPVDAQTANRCRSAWLEGKNAALKVDFHSYALIEDSEIIPRWEPQLEYVIQRSVVVGGESRMSRHIRPEMHRLMEVLSFLTGDEITLRALQVILGRENNETLKWLSEEIHLWGVSYAADSPEIDNPEFTDLEKINAFTVLQAYILGYSYELFSKVVNTSLLTTPVVEGAWGFRSATFLTGMRHFYHGEPLKQARLIILLSMFFLGGDAEHFPSSDFGKEYNSNIIGVVRKRALVLGSIIDPSESGRLILLDIDVSGIPMDINGIIRAGIPDQPKEELNTEDFMTHGLFRNVLKQDATFHVEVDWDNNPETMVLCVRYQGRRLRTMNPQLADVYYYIMTKMSLEKRFKNRDLGKVLSHAKQWSLADVFKVGIPPLDDKQKDLVLKMCIPRQYPRLRYFVAYFFGIYRSGIGILAAPPVFTRRELILLLSADDDEEEIP